MSFCRGEVAPTPAAGEAPPLRLVRWQSASGSKHMRFLVERERCGAPSFRPTLAKGWVWK